jgi:hypothetical protein
MRPAVVALILAVLGSVLAAPAAYSAEEASKSAPTIALESVALPIIVDGRLINYVFCSIQLDLNPYVDGSLVRAKEQFFRDDLVRAGHRAPFTRRDDYTKVDEAKVRAEILRFAPSVVGPGVVRSAVITKQVSLKLMTLPGVQQQRPREIIP